MINKIFCLALLFGGSKAQYRHKIEPFSFDIQKFEYPLEYQKFGTAIALKDTIKLLPKVAGRFGGLYMTQVSLFFCDTLYPCSQSRQTNMRLTMRSKSKTIGTPSSKET